jgi:hypothetical protein
LLGGFQGDAAPAGYSLRGREGEVLLCSVGEDRSDAGDAELGGLFDGPLEVVELEDGKQQMDGQGCVGFEFFVEGEEDFYIRDRCDLGAMEEAVGYDIEELAGLRAEDAR